jgi:hypothetical protein
MIHPEHTSPAYFAVMRPDRFDSVAFEAVADFLEGFYFVAKSKPFLQLGVGDFLVVDCLLDFLLLFGSSFYLLDIRVEGVLGRLSQYDVGRWAPWRNHNRFVVGYYE